MSADAAVGWAFVVAWVLLAAFIVLFPVRRAVGEAARIVRRISVLVDSSPLPLQLAKAEADIERITRAIDRFPELERRVRAAFAIATTTPLVPPALGRVICRIGADVRAFRAERR